MRPCVRVLGPGLCLTLLVSGAAAREPQTFRTRTELVEVPVIVTDRDNRPVAGLTREDFTVREDGAPQEIRLFEVRDTRDLPEDRLPVVSTGFGADAAFTNRGQNPSGSAVVLLLDRTNAAFDSQWFARRHLDTYLSRMREGDRAALYAIDGGVRVLHDFTADAASLRRALDAYQALVSGPYEASQEPPAETGSGEGLPVWIVDPSTAVSDFYTRRRFLHTFEAMKELARHLAGIAGRKTVVWMSEAFAIPSRQDRAEFLELMREATRALTDAQASLYPVDARGLVGAISYQRGTPSFTSFATVRGNLETMEDMAERTGGRAFGNTNALDVSIARAVEDGRATYLLGYYPQDTREDGRFRAIDVKVRGRGLRVRARRGYFADERPLDVKSRDEALQEALRAPLGATEIGLAANIDYEGPGRVRIDLRIDPSTLALDVVGDGGRGAVDVLVAEVTPRARGTVLHTDSLDVFVPNADRAAVFRDGIRFSCTVPVTRALRELRIIVRDAPSGRVGSLVIAEARLARGR